MRSGQNIWTGLSSVVQRPVLRTANQQVSNDTRHRFHRRLIGIVLVLIGLFGSPSVGLAGPIIVETEDTGGSGGMGLSAQGSGSIEQVDGAPLGPQLTVNQRTAVRLFNEVFVQQKPDVCALLMTANAVNHTPAGDFEGPAGFEQYVAEVWSTYPDAAFAIDEGVVDGDLVTLNWTISGQASDGAGQVGGTATLRFEEHMITESWIEYADAAPAGQVEPNAAPETCPPCREP